MINQFFIKLFCTGEINIVHNVSKQLAQRNSGTNRESNPGPTRARIPSVLTTRPLSHIVQITWNKPSMDPYVGKLKGSRLENTSIIVVLWLQNLTLYDTLLYTGYCPSVVLRPLIDRYRFYRNLRTARERETAKRR